MDVGLSLRYVFEDRRWVGKSLIAVLVSIVPILNLAWQGYLIELMRNVSDRVEPELPEWDDFGKKFIDGLIILVVSLIYSLPAIILIIVIAIAAGVTDMTTGGDVEDVIYGVYSGFAILVSCLVMLYSILLAIYLPGVMLHYAREDSFGACFQIGKIVRLITRNLGDYLIAWLVTILTAFVIGLLASIVVSILFITCCLIPVAIALGAFVSVWPMMVYAHLFGQVGRPSGGELAPVEA